MSINKYYKEKDYIEGLLKKNKIDAGIRGDLKTLAKYYKYLGQDEKEIEKSLYEFCEKKCKGWFNKVRHYKMIDNAVTHAFKDDSVLIQIESIPITKNEIEFIESLEYEELDKKVMFSLIVINKLNNERLRLRGIDFKSNYFGGSGEYSYKSLMDTLSEKLTRTYREKGIHKTIKQFNDNGLTRTTNKLSLELIFLNQIEDNNEIMIQVLDFDVIGLYYDYYTGKEKVRLCEECRVDVFKKTNNSSLYCKKCAKEKQKEWQKNSMKKARNRREV